MKKVYSIPTVEVIQLSTVNAILEGSNSGNSGEVTPGGGFTRPAANEHRGEWGSVWGN